MSRTAEPTPSSPAIVVLGPDEASLRRVADELERRYGADYEIAAHLGHDAFEADLRRRRELGSPVALMVAVLGAQDPDALEVLAGVRALHPSARRLAAVRWGDFERAQEVFDALARGGIDHFVVGPEQARDEEFHSSVTGSLEDWALEQGTPFEAVRVIGDRSARSQELRDGFTRNHIPLRYVEADSPAGAEQLAGLGLQDPDLPVVVLQFTAEPQVLEDPSDIELADAFGLTAAPPTDVVHDLVIVGAGPAGLAAAVYAASEGLGVLVVEQQAVGGQAGTSSLIRNYPGFPRGVSGAKLAFQTFQQAWSFGASFHFGREVTGLTAEGTHRMVALNDGSVLRARTVLVANGVQYVRIPVPELEPWEGRGVFYGAAVSEALTTRGCRVHVVGAGNSAGQAAVHLAKFAEHVTMLVRGPTLADSMSEYLQTVIAATPNIEVHFGAEVSGGGGTDAFDHLVVRDRASGDERRVPSDALFTLIGAQPRTEWLEGVVLRDGWGSLLTGRDLPADAFPLERAPYPNETSLPGVFAAGDVRRGAVKRVASAVGDGAVTIPLVHQYLAGLSDAVADPVPTRG